MGIILYGKDLKIITKSPDNETVDNWAQDFAKFRAVEEYCFKYVRWRIQQKDIWNWLNSEIPEYERKINEIVTPNTISDNNARQFLISHGSAAQKRVRGAALYCAIADNLAKIALYISENTESWAKDNPLPANDLLDSAELYLKQFVALNVESIQKIANDSNALGEAKLSNFFKLEFPDYLREIISAVELRRRNFPNETVFTLDEMQYTPKNPSFKGYLKECIRELNKRENPKNVLGRIKLYYKIDLMKEQDGKWKVTLLSKDPVTQIEPLGVLSIGVFGTFGNS